MVELDGNEFSQPLKKSHIACKNVLMELDSVWCVKGLIMTRPRWALFLDTPWFCVCSAEVVLVPFLQLILLKMCPNEHILYLSVHTC